MAERRGRDSWEDRFVRMLDLVLDDLGGLRQTLSEGQVSEDRRARRIRAIDEMEDDYLELAARVVEGTREQPRRPPVC